jgi:hypothetical protein
MQRLSNRGRPEEVAGITLEYLQQLDAAKAQYQHLITVDGTPLDVAMAVTALILPNIESK